MKDAKKVGFDVRHNGVGITYIGSSVGTPHDKERDIIENGDNVQLQINNISVFVKSVKQLSVDSFKGLIVGHNCPHVSKFEGPKIGEEIVFQECHVFTCGKVYG